MGRAEGAPPPRRPSCRGSSTHTPSSLLRAPVPLTAPFLSLCRRATLPKLTPGAPLGFPFAASGKALDPGSLALICSRLPLLFCLSLLPTGRSLRPNLRWLNVSIFSFHSEPAGDAAGPPGRGRLAGQKPASCRLPPAGPGASPHATFPSLGVGMAELSPTRVPAGGTPSSVISPSAFFSPQLPSPFPQSSL